MAWAREIAERQGLSDAQVLDAWKPYLTARAIWALGGRPPEERFAVLRGDWAAHHEQHRAQRTRGRG